MPIREMNSEEIYSILEGQSVGRLGLCKDGQPYIVPVHYLYKDRKIYFHSKTDGMKMEYLSANPRVCFEVDELVSVVLSQPACHSFSEYKSVVTFGKAKPVGDSLTKRNILKELVIKYAGGKQIESMIIEDIDTLAVVEIIVDEMSGKISSR